MIEHSKPSADQPETDKEGLEIIKHESTAKLTVIGIGASAGGLEALKDFLVNFPTDIQNVAIIIAQHLSPHHKSMLVQLLSRNTQLQVKEAQHYELLAANIVYITPPDKEISIHNKHINLQKPSSMVGPKPSVDVLFQSLAEEDDYSTIGIILSGTGSDGAQGITAIRQSGGITIAQEPSTAKYDGMPVSAIETGSIDMILAVDKMGEKIREYILHPERLNSQDEIPSNRQESLERIFQLLSKRTGTDFSNYKPATINRRLDKRMLMLSIESVEDYLDYIEDKPTELDDLFEMYLIGVTSFFRDKDAFDALEAQIKKIIGTKNQGDVIRIWVPGCATGEEPYSIAIILSRLLKNKIQEYNIQIFATDIDEKAIAKARRGVYPESAINGLSDEMLGAYFLKRGEGYELIKNIRSMVLFSRHDLTSNPPFLKLDLITCRNLLIYFGASLQQQIMPIFHYALNLNGILFLGKSETIGQFSDLFATIDAKSKLFQRKRGGNLHNVRFSAFKPQKILTHIAKKNENQGSKEYSLKEMLKETFFQTFEHPYVIINDSYDVIEISGDVRIFFNFPEGSMNANIIKLIIPELQIELRSIISQALKNQQTRRSKLKKIEFFGQLHYMRFIVKPVMYSKGANQFFLVIFERFESTDLFGEFLNQPNDIPQESRMIELEQELAATKEHLQTYIEELETTNEELQSLNEEMQSTNEELQSSNEELETSNEELQSTNEEIQIAYSELKSTHEELQDKDDLLRKKDENQEALLSNTLQAFILIDATYKINVFNQKAYDSFVGLFGKELKVGNSIIDILENDYLEYFTQDIQKALKGETIKSERVIKDIEGQSRWFNYNYTPVLDAREKISVISISLLEISDLKQAMLSLGKVEKLLASVFNATNIGICVTDEQGHFVSVNREYAHIYGYEVRELIGRGFEMVLPPESRVFAKKMHDDFIIGIPEMPMEWQVQRKDGTLIEIYVGAELLIQEDGSRYKVTSVRDITESKRYKKLLVDTQENAKVGGWEYDPFTEELILTGEVYKLLEIKEDTELSIKNVTSFFVEEDAKLLTDAFEHASQFGTPFNLTTKTNGLSTKWLQITAKPLHVHRKTVKVFGTFQDVTERKNYEIELKKTLELLQETNLIAHIGGWEFDVIKQKLFWSPITKEIHEVSSDYEPTLAEGIYFYKEGENREKIQLLVQEAIEHGNPWDTDLQIITQKGREKWVRAKGRAEFVNGVCVRLFGVFQDIDYQKRQSIRLNQIEQRWKFGLEGSGDGIWDWNIESDDVFFSDRWKTMLGYETDEISSKLESWEALVHQDDLQSCYDELNKHFEGKIDVYQKEHRLRCKDGSYKWILTRGKVTQWSKDQKPLRIIGVHTDISKQVEAAEKLRENEAFLQKILNQSADIICTIDAQGRFIQVSAASSKIWGYTPEEMQGRFFVEFVIEEDQAKSINTAKQVMEGQRITDFENRYRHKNGQIIPIIWSARWDEDSQNIYAVARDATDIQKSKAQLEAYSQRVTNVLESINDGFFTLDKEWRVTYWNHRAEMIMGVPKENIIHKNLWEVLKEAISLKFYTEYHKAAKENISTDFEEFYPSLNSWLGVSVYPSKEGLSIYFRDITKRKIAEEELQKSKDQLQTIMDFAPMVVFMKDLKGRYLFFNEGYKKAISHQDLKLGMTDYDIFEEDFADNCRRVDKRIIQNKLPESFEHQVGEEVFLEMKFLLENQNNEPYAIAGISINITEGKKAAEEVRLAKERYDIVMEATNDAIWDWDMNKENVFWGKGYQRLFGYEICEEGVKEDFWKTCIHPDDFNRIWGEIMQVRQDKHTNKWTGEYRFKKANGEYAYIREKAIIIRNPKTAKPYRMIGALQDITKQKEEEERLKLLESVVTHTTDSVLITEAEPFDLPGPKIVYVNDAFTKMTGYAPEDVIGKTPRILQGPNSDRETLDKLRKALENWESLNIDLINYKKNGEEFWVNFSVVPVADENGFFTHWVAIERDITRQKKYEQHLNELNTEMNQRAQELANSNAELEQFAYIASHDLQEPLRMVTSFLTQLDKKYKDQLDEKAQKYIHFAVDGAVRMRKILLDLLEYSRVGRNEAKQENIMLDNLLEEIITLNLTLIQEKDAQIKWEKLPAIKAGRTHMQQLFQNIITNALKYQNPLIQPYIEIRHKELRNHWQFEIKDNGIGIEKQFFDKVFVIFQRLHSREEYSGTGIGLAICKKIVERYHGKIWIESEIGKGTTFYFTIRK